MFTGERYERRTQRFSDFLLSSAYGQKLILQTHIYDQASGRSWTTLGKAYAISH